MSYTNFMFFILVYFLVLNKILSTFVCSSACYLESLFAVLNWMSFCLILFVHNLTYQILSHFACHQYLVFSSWLILLFMFYFILCLCLYSLFAILFRWQAISGVQANSHQTSKVRSTRTTINSTIKVLIWVSK